MKALFTDKIRTNGFDFFCWATVHCGQCNCLAGGTHHTSFSYDLTVEYWEDYAEMAGIEMVVIDENTTISEFKKELRMNEVYYMLNKALC